jgi:hypothetical protein
MNPLEVWLFGNRAEDRARPTSDHDLLVMMPDGTPEPDLDPVRAWRLGWEAQVTADISRARAASLRRRSTRSTRYREQRRCAGARCMSVEKRLRAYLELATKDAEAADLLLAGGNRYAA